MRPFNVDSVAVGVAIPGPFRRTTKTMIATATAAMTSPVRVESVEFQPPEEDGDDVDGDDVVLMMVTDPDPASVTYTSSSPGS